MRFSLTILYLYLVSGINTMGVCNPQGVKKFQDSTKVSSIMVGADYSSNTSSFGRFSSIAHQPSYSSFISYYFKNGINLNLSPVAIDNSDSAAANFTYELDFGLGYDWNIGSYFTVSPSYYHYFYSKNSYSLKSLYNDELCLTVSFSKGKIFTSLNSYYLMGEYYEWMNSADLGLNFQFSGFSKKHAVIISPECNVISGNQKYYNQVAYRNYWYLYKLAQRNPNTTIQNLYDLPANYPFIWKYLRNRPRVLKNFQELDKNLTISDLFKAENKYNLSSVSFTLPVFYNIGSLSLNLSYCITFPLNLPSYMDKSAINYISAGFYYSFSL